MMVIAPNIINANQKFAKLAQHKALQLDHDVWQGNKSQPAKNKKKAGHFVVPQSKHVAPAAGMSSQIAIQFIAAHILFSSYAMYTFIVLKSMQSLHTENDHGVPW